MVPHTHPVLPCTTLGRMRLSVCVCVCVCVCVVLHMYAYVCVEEVCGGGAVNFLYSSFAGFLALSHFECQRW